MLHEKELVLNKFDTQNILDAVSVVRDLMSKLPKLNIPTFNPSMATSSGNTISMPITIENMNGTREGVNDFFKQINKEMQSLGVKFIR